MWLIEQLYVAFHSSYPGVSFLLSHILHPLQNFEKASMSTHLSSIIAVTKPLRDWCPLFCQAPSILTHFLIGSVVSQSLLKLSAARFIDILATDSYLASWLCKFSKELLARLNIFIHLAKASIPDNPFPFSRKPITLSRFDSYILRPRDKLFLVSHVLEV